MRLIIILSLACLFTGCAAYPGTDGRTYYWPKPLPINNQGNWSASPTATTSTYVVNGSRTVTVTSFK